MTAMDVRPSDAPVVAEIQRLKARVLELEDLLAAARANCEREQDEHQSYRAAHKGACEHPTCRLRMPHGHAGGER